MSPKTGRNPAVSAPIRRSSATFAGTWPKPPQSWDTSPNCDARLGPRASGPLGAVGRGPRRPGRRGWPVDLLLLSARRDRAHGKCAAKRGVGESLCAARAWSAALPCSSCVSFQSRLKLRAGVHARFRASQVDQLRWRVLHLHRAGSSLEQCTERAVGRRRPRLRSRPCARCCRRSLSGRPRGMSRAYCLVPCAGRSGTLTGGRLSEEYWKQVPNHLLSYLFVRGLCRC